MPAQPTSPILAAAAAAACSFDHMHFERLAGPCTIHTKVLACSSSNNLVLAASRPLLPGLVYSLPASTHTEGILFRLSRCRYSVSHAPRQADGHLAVRADWPQPERKNRSINYPCYQVQSLGYRYTTQRKRQDPTRDLAGCKGSTDLAAAL
ncbi:hypothetical protein HDV57DRAFT_219407 [Trichoderma longibrachiatum]|uniref:Uncharacterized protein n=1 Tax=Trichoderma longibrachiatum ATCC 18648 TaxID=983965 RepID=A0A2T4C7T1_TRILO|nr:hypothetical protein M440DRAFT_1216832 [Trichoderma longibrachiatum ATCC 18648]